jgi:hypothetical protein
MYPNHNYQNLNLMWVIKHKTRNIYYKADRKIEGKFSIISHLHNATVFNDQRTPSTICFHFLPKSWLATDSNYSPFDFKVHKVSVRLVESSPIVE